MKSLLTFALCVTATYAQQPTPAKAPDIGNIISSLMSGFKYLESTLREAGNDFKNGTPIAVVVDRTLPKLLPEAKLHSRVETDSKNLMRTSSKKGKASFGPYTLVGKNDYRPYSELMSLDPRGQGKLTYLPKGNLCGGKDCTILTARLGLTYEDGREASPETGVYIHHLLSFNPSRPSTNAIGLCDVTDPDKDLGFINKILPSNLPIAPFTGRGEDGGPVSATFTSEDGKYDSGFHLGKNDYLVVQSDLVNYSNETQNVYLTYEYEYVDGFQGVSAISTLLSVTGCLLIIPPKVNMTGRAVTISRKFPIVKDATILNIRGHMHDGGDRMIFAINDKPVCESLPEYKDRQLWSMSACGTPVDVKKGDWITLTSIYDVPNHPLRPGVVGHGHAQNILGMNDLMGMFGVVFAAKQNVTKV